MNNKSSLGRAAKAAEKKHSRLGPFTGSMTKKATEKPYLPNDIIFSRILSTLAAKSLLRFRCTNKLWNTTIQDPNFISSHSLHASNSPSLLGHFIYQLKYLTHKSFFFYFVDPKNQNRSFKFLSKTYDETIGCCNGLFCLISASGFGILNPSTREILFHPIAKPIQEWLLKKDHPRHGLVSYGFGFDSLKNEYKYLQVLIDENTAKCFVYTLGTNSWREKDITVTNNLVLNYFRASLTGGIHSLTAFHSNGALHWFSKSPVNKIIRFDLHQEEFVVIDSPQYPAHLKYHSMVTRQGCLCLAFQDDRGKYEVKISLYKQQKQQNSWVMESIGILKPSTPFTIVDRLGFCLWKSPGSITSYDPQTKKCEVVPFWANEDRSLEGYGFNDHVDNLLSLESVVPPGETQVRYMTGREININGFTYKD